MFIYIFIFLFAVSLIFISAQPEQEQGDDSFQTDSSGSGESKLGTAWWIEPMSGYRFTVVDSKFNLVLIDGKSSLDILFSEIEEPKQFDFYKNSRVASGEDFNLFLKLEKEDINDYLWDEILIAM